MEPLKLKATVYTPLVNFNPVQDIFLVSGRSSPEDASNFYLPILTWLEEYLKNPNKKTIFELKLPYYNTSSSKLILTILTNLEKFYEDGIDILIKWYFPEDDEDIEEAGEEYADIVDIPFEFISY